MKRRDFLTAASGLAGGTAAASAAASAQETTTSSGNATASGNQTATGNETANGTEGTTTGAPASGPTREVVVGPGGSLVFEPADITIAPGTTINFVWESDNHNVVPSSQPEGANWQGTEGAPDKTYDTGHEYSHTFQTTGTYEYFCEPHKQVGMTGTITVQEGGAQSSGGGGEVDPEHMGVPFQAHFVGIATILMMIVSLVYTFFLLKYGESPHASGGN